MQLPDPEPMEFQRGHQEHIQHKPVRDPRVRRRHRREHSETRNEALNDRELRRTNADDHAPEAMNFKVGLDSMEVERSKAKLNRREDKRESELSTVSGSFNQGDDDKDLATKRS